MDKAMSECGYGEGDEVSVYRRPTLDVPQSRSMWLSRLRSAVRFVVNELDSLTRETWGDGQRHLRIWVALTLSAVAYVGITFGAFAVSRAVDPCAEHRTVTVESISIDGTPAEVRTKWCARYKPGREPKP